MTDMTERLAALPAERRARFLAQLRERTEAAARRPPTSRGDTGPTPLSYAQETLRFFDRTGPDSVALGPLCLRLQGELDAHALRLALAAAVDRHDALRTAIVEHESGPMQVVAPEVPVELPLIRADGDDHEQRMAAARALVERQVREPFDLSRTPMWRAMLISVAQDDHLFLLDVPLIAWDAWSRGVLMRELAEFYQSVRVGDAPGLPHLPVQYPDYAVWQRGRLDRRDKDKLAAYWRDQLAGVEVMEFPADRPRGETWTFTGSSGTFTIGHEGLDRVAELARDESASLLDVTLAAFLTLLHRYCGQTDLVIGSPIANRSHDVSSVIGRFTDILVLRTDVSGNPSFRELVQRVKRVSSEAYGHGGLPFERLLDAVDLIVDPSRPPIFQIVFGVENAVPTAGLPGIVTSQEAVQTCSGPFDMSWSLAERAAPGADALMTVEFNSDLFDTESIARLTRHYDALLTSLTADPDASISVAEMFSRADREFLADVSQGPMRPIRESTIVEQFESRVRESPHSVAVVVAGVETSYAELNARANRLATLLREHGVEPGTRVGLCLRRNIDLPTAILAVLKAGAAYVPLDSTSPSARVAEITSDAKVRVVITHAGCGRTVSEVDAPVLTLEDVREELAAMPDHDLPLAAEPGDDAYVIYTSGSTGKPKGVLLQHRGVINFIDSTKDLFDLTPADRVLGFASVTFDVSVFEMFSALLTGARLYLATEDERLSIDRLQSLMERTGITVIDLPPTVMPLLAPEKLTNLRIVFVGGEAFSGELVNRWNPGRRLFNGYGPSECTVTMIVEECSGNWNASPPIGLPMANHVAHVLDRNLRPVPVGVPGELVIGGAGLARGYLDRDELTAEKFIPDPFGTAPGGRLYRTGDLAKRLADGRLVFLGRLDQQVKIRGHRIELSEVESALATFNGVGPVSVQSWADSNGDKHLVGYLTRITEQQVPAVRRHLDTLLPSYMIPSYFVVLDELPLTSSGKVDRRRLPAPNLRRASGGFGDESLTATQRRLMRDVLAPLLHYDGLGVHDDFFLVGGNSLKAVQLMSAINRTFGVDIALGDFFASPTAAHLAVIIDSARAAASRDDDDPLNALASLTGADASRDAAPSDDRAPVVMRSSGPAQVILLHPSGGEVFCYTPLGRALREDIGVIAFAADPRDADVTPQDRMAATGTRIAQAVIRRGLQELFCLAGWSYGGVLAFEVARQIEQRTGERHPVILLDAAYGEDTGPLDEPTLRQQFVHDLVRLMGRDGQAGRAVLDDPATGAADISKTLRGLGVELDLTEQELASHFRTFRSCALSMQAYRPPSPYRGPVTLLTASPRRAMEERWQMVCTGPFRVERLPGDHYTVFTEPALSRVVAAIEETLAS